LLGAALRQPKLVGLAVAGLLLSLVLELMHVRAYLAPASGSFCSIGAHLDCTSVALSRWSVVLGLPLPIWGTLAFLAIGVAAWLGSAWVVPLALAAALGSVGLLAIELVAVGALCLLCEAVHALGIALAILAWRARASLTPLRDRDQAALVLLPPLGLMLALLLFLPPYFRTVVYRAELPFPEGVTPDGAPWIGAREPQLTVDEYTDYTCPHCRAATGWTLKRLAARPTEIRIVRRQLPLARCHAEQKGSCERVRLAYCAGEEHRFWQMDRWLFSHGEDKKLDHAAAAREIGLDPAKLGSCLERPETYARAERESDNSAKRRFIGAPGYLANGKRVTSEIVDRYLAQGHAD
jgi:uncharacterized membrane protein